MSVRIDTGYISGYGWEEWLQLRCDFCSRTWPEDGSFAESGEVSMMMEEEGWTRCWHGDGQQAVLDVCGDCRVSMYAEVRNG